MYSSLASLVPHPIVLSPGKPHLGVGSSGGFVSFLGLSGARFKVWAGCCSQTLSWW